MSQDTPARADAGPALRRMMLIDTLIGILVNAGVFPFILWLARLAPPTRAFGASGGLTDAIKATAFPVVLMTIIMTLVLRARFRKHPVTAADLVGSPAADGAAPQSPATAFVRNLTLSLGSPASPPSPLASSPVPPLPSPVLWLLARPRPPVEGKAPNPATSLAGLLLRTLAFTLLAVIVLAPLRVAICAALGLYPMTVPGFTLLNVLHGAVIGTLFMPLIILSAMADTAPPR